MMAGEFWLDDQQWAVIAPLLPTNQPGARRTDDRRVISGIIHVLKTRCRWQDCPACYGPATTIYNRLHRWSARGIWRRLFEALIRTGDGDIHMIDSTTAKAHRSAAGGKGGRMLRQSVAREAADRQRSMLLSIVAAVPSRLK
jgi:transposase